MSRKVIEGVLIGLGIVVSNMVFFSLVLALIVAVFDPSNIGNGILGASMVTAIAFTIVVVSVCSRCDS